MNIYKNISDKIEPPIVEAISRCVHVSDKLAIPFMVVGATARDVIFSTIFGIPTRRATLDVDLAVRVKNWAEYSFFREALLQSGVFSVERESRAHRFRHSNGTLVDLIPFGGIEDPPGFISWPPHHDVAMPIIGFVDMFDAAVIIRFRNKPILDVSVITLAGLAISKLIAWNARSSATPKDATDLYFIMTKYVDAGNDDRPYHSDSDISEEPDFDYTSVSPRLLGRDMAAIMSGDTREVIENILVEETRDESDFLLARHMSYHSADDDGTQQVLKLLKQLQLGLTERT